MENEYAHILKLEESYRNLPHKMQVIIWNHYALMTNRSFADNKRHIYLVHTLKEIEDMLKYLEWALPRKDFERLFTKG